MLRKAGKIVAFIPARGGSQSIPLKNIALIGGKPLLYWVARACSQSTLLSEIFVATECEEIRNCVEAMALERVSVIGRSPSTATHEASTESALMEFAERREFDHVVLVQATSPLLRTLDIEGAIETFMRGAFDSLLTVVRTKRFMWRNVGGCVEPENYSLARRPRRQDWAGQLVENGALYITSRSALKESGTRLSGRIGSFEMPADSYLELDEPEDWLYIDHLLRLRS